MKKVLITAPYFQLVLEKYRKIFEDHGFEIIAPEVNERMSEEELIPLVGDIDGILCGDDRITEKVLVAAPKLKVIVKWGTGIDSIDKEAAARRGIPVRNTPNAFTEPVSDSVLGYILCFARDIIGLDREMREGIWKKKMTSALNECTLGIIGLGNVGTAVKKRAESFGMKVVANDIKQMNFGFMIPLEKLLAESDFVSINCDLNPMSFHLMNKERLAMMKPTAYLINTARGPIVDEKALVEVLQTGKIAGTALDVFEDEPLLPDSPLRKMENVILSPHNTNGSLKAWERVHENSINSLIEGLLKK
ncbi:MAG TPA: phosphoglycerate dehydrogenase [Candidatus Paceibacterota bacterium]|nr:phosphoglycerate dehydrogenase [Candidatus Paceibacterota bacterium]